MEKFQKSTWATLDSFSSLCFLNFQSAFKLNGKNGSARCFWGGGDLARRFDAGSVQCASPV